MADAAAIVSADALRNPIRFDSRHNTAEEPALLTILQSASMWLYGYHHSVHHPSTSSKTTVSFSQQVVYMLTRELTTIGDTGAIPQSQSPSTEPLLWPQLFLRTLWRFRVIYPMLHSSTHLPICSLAKTDQLANYPRQLQSITLTQQSVPLSLAQMIPMIPVYCTML